MLPRDEPAAPDMTPRNRGARRAGFQPVVLAPVNFEALYQQNRQQAEAQAGTDLPIQ